MKIQHPPRFPTPPQVLNAAWSLVGLGVSRLLHRPVPLGSPVMLMVEPGTACNLHCPHCPTGRGELSRPAGRMTLEMFRSIWDDIRPPPIRLQLWNQGEPFTNVDTVKIIRHAAGSGSQVVLATNGEMLANGDLAEAVAAAGLHELVLSLDGASPESHRKYRIDGDFEKVEKGIRKIVEARRRLGLKHPLLTWQFLLFRHNLAERSAAKKLARKWGVDRVVFKTAQLENLSREEGERWLPRDPRLRRYRLQGDRWVLKRKRDFFCNRLFTSAVVLWDGEVVPCCFDKDGDFPMGNALGYTFPRIWHGESYQNFRQRWIEGDRPEMCNNCTEGLKKLYAG